MNKKNDAPITTKEISNELAVLEKLIEQIALLQQEIEKIKKTDIVRKGEEYPYSSYPYSSCASANYPYYFAIINNK